MAEKHLIAAVEHRFKGMRSTERIAKVRKLASVSAADKAFIRETFPDLYRERIRRRKLLWVRTFERLDVAPDLNCNLILGNL